MSGISKIIVGTERTSNFLGFTSVHDFVESLIRLKDWSFNSSVVIVGALTSFITGYVWDSHSAIYTLWTLMLADWITGIAKSIKNKSFVSYRVYRMPLYYIAVSFLLSISYWIEKSSSLFFFLPSIVIAGFYSVYFISLLENCGELGLLPKSLVSVLRKKVGLKSLIDKFSNDEK